MKKVFFFLVAATLFLSFSEKETEIKWMTVEEAEKANAENPKRWLIDVSTVWCGWCKKMDKTTFQDPKIVEYVNEHFYAVKLDGEEKKTINFNGKDYNFVDNGRRGYHELPAALMNGQMSYPTVVFLTKNQQTITPVAGYQTKEDFHKAISYINDLNLNSPISFEEYGKTYQSPYGK